MTRERQPGDVLYNVRDGDFDPRSGLRVPPVEVDIAAEPGLTLWSWRGVKTMGGPLTRALAERVFAIAPVAEHDKMRFTVRAETIAAGELSPLAAPGWHTDYAHNVTRVSVRRKVHNYLLVTGPPLTAFIHESNVWLPSRVHNQELLLTQFGIRPWTIVRFNATELHRAEPNSFAEPVPRLFFRATYDPLR